MLGRIPELLQVIIEIPADSPAIQYEVDNKSGALFVKRFLETSMHFPCDYGYIPQTASIKNDFLRALVITPIPVIRHCQIHCRVIGMLEVNCHGNIENKIVTVPTDALTERYDDVHTVDDLPTTLLSKIAHFFKHYQDVPLNKAAVTTTWHDKSLAIAELIACMDRYNGKLKELAIA
jgi:inorganic pyrophosphatase